MILGNKEPEDTKNRVPCAASCLFDPGGPAGGGGAGTTGGLRGRVLRDEKQGTEAGWE